MYAARAMENILGQLFRHNRWANLALLDACKDLTDSQLDATVQGTQGTIRETLKHIVGAEERYVGLLGGAQPDKQREREPWEGIGALREAADANGLALIEIAEAEQPGRVLRATWRGTTHEMPAWLPLTQAINHATEHRSQIATILTQQGVEPPSMDGWTFHEQASR